ncbi:retention module-containing protein, partial [Colwellia sp. RSH04]|uniref:retention module-containing protein n=1 Tax=Colwellia sp. RSH04 TaxID=2305464 RepID=UPI000E56D08F
MQEVKLVEVGNVISVVGNVVIINADGQKRALKTGDKVSPGDVILTPNDARVFVQFDGHANSVAIEPSCIACISLDENANAIAKTQVISGDVLAIEQQNVEQLQQLILNGVDPTVTNQDEINNLQELIANGVDPTSVEEFEAAAAGEAGNQGSSTSPKIDATIEEVEVTAGFDTSYSEGSIQSTPPADDENAPRPAIISGEDQVIAIEDSLTVVNGSLDVIDTNEDEAQFIVNSIETQYGVFTIDEDGNWQFQLNNELSVIQSLDVGESLFESVVVTSVDGTEHTVNIEIQGSEDISIVSLVGDDTDVGAVTEDVAVNEDNQLTTSGHLTVTDVDTSDTAAFDPESVTSSNTLGVLTIDAEGNWLYNIDNTLEAVQSLDEGESFTETFIVRTIDGQTHEITVTVNGVDDVSVVSLEAGDTDVGSVTEDTAVNVNNQLTTSGHLTVTDVDTSDTAAFDPASVTSEDTLGVLTIDAEGNWLYNIDNTLEAVQSLDEGESFTETFIVRTIDGQTHEITVTVNGVDDVSVVSLEAGDTDVGSVTEDTAVNVNNQLTTSGHLTVTDVDTSDTAAFDPASVTSSNTLGVLTIDAEGNWLYNIDNTLAAVQELGVGESFTETFIVSTVDGQTHEITVTVNGVNDGPVAVDDNVSLDEDSSAIIIDVLSNDTDLEGDSLTVTAVTQPTNGTVALVNGVVTYIPEPNFNGVVTFTYTISDGNGGTDTATVTLTVDPQNDNPIAVDDNVSINKNDGATVIDVLTNDSDLDGDTLTVTAVTQPLNGTVTLVNGVVTYIPEANFTGLVTFTYTISDGNGGTDTATVTLNVNDNGDITPPSIADQSFSYEENQVADAVVGTLANNPDVATYTFSNGSTTSADGYYHIDNNGVITITAAGILAHVNDFEVGANSGDYDIIASDAAGNETTITVTLSETDVDDTAPSVADQSFSYEENQVADAVVGTLANNADVTTYTFSNGSQTSADGYYHIDNNGVITITAAGILAHV